MELVNDRAGGRVELPLHQPVLRSQFQHLVGAEDVLEWRPTVVVRLEDDGELEGRGDAGVRRDAAQRLQPVFTLQVHHDGGAPEPARLVGRGAHHVPADSGGHLAGQQQHLAAKRGSLGLGETALYQPGQVLLEEPLFILQARVQVGTC